jgi:hypothetical protein
MPKNQAWPCPNLERHHVRTLDATYVQTLDMAVRTENQVAPFKGRQKPHSLGHFPAIFLVATEAATRKISSGATCTKFPGNTTNSATTATKNAPKKIAGAPGEKLTAARRTDPRQLRGGCELTAPASCCEIVAGCAGDCASKLLAQSQPQCAKLAVLAWRSTAVAAVQKILD